MNLEETRKLIARLEEAGISTKRFLKVGKGEPAFEKGEDKAAFESFDYDSGRCLYGPEDFHLWLRWGICGGGGLVLVDKDNRTMAAKLDLVLSPTFDVLSPRRKLPQSYYLVEGGEVPNKVLFLPSDKEGSGEIRSKNEYLVAPGTEIRFLDLQTGEKRTGTYTVLHDRPIAKIKFDHFMKVVKPYLGSAPSQRITFAQMRKGVPSGVRHAQGIKYATFLIGVKEFDDATALHELKEWNQLCKPPMPERDIERMVENARGYVKGGTRKKEEESKATVDLKGHDVYSKAVDIFEITVKGDRRSIEFIFPTIMSAYTTEPNNLGLEAPTSEGKTYPVTEIAQYFPKEDIWFLGGLSPTALPHDHGILIGDDDEPLAQRLKGLQKQKRKAKRAKDDDKFDAVEDEIRELMTKSKYLVDLEGKVLIFLEAPQLETFAKLRPILSHDVYEIMYKFTDRSGKGSLRTSTVVVRGWPAVIYLKAGRGREDQIWDQIQSRFTTISPRMDKGKYRAAIELTAMRKGLPNAVFRHKLKLERSKDAKRWICDIRRRLLEITHNARKATEEDAPNIFWIPFHEEIGKNFPAVIGRHMRDSKRFLSAMQMSATINVFARPILKVEGVEYIVVILEDYERAVRLYLEGSEELFSGLPGHVIAFFKEIVLSLWDDRFAKQENAGEQRTLDKKEEIEPPEFTASDFVKKYTKVHKETKKTLSANTIYRYYLTPLESAGLMSKKTDPENKKRYLWTALKREIIPQDWCDYLRNKNAGILTLDLLKERLNEVISIGASNPENYVFDSQEKLTAERLYQKYYCKMGNGAPIEISPKVGDKPKNPPKDTCVSKTQGNALIPKQKETKTADSLKPVIEKLNEPQEPPDKDTPKTEKEASVGVPEKTPKVERTTQDLETAICAYPSKTVISEDKLAEELGVPLDRIRVALGALALKGMVIPLGNRMWEML